MPYTNAESRRLLSATICSCAKYSDERPDTTYEDFNIEWGDSANNGFFG